MDADIVIKNGKLYSVDLEGQETRGEAVAILDGKILALGSDADIMRYIGEETTIIDAEGNSVLPGFCDAHVHATISTILMHAGC